MELWEQVTSLASLGDVSYKRHNTEDSKELNRKEWKVRVDKVL